jgi:hypothetical protein
MDRQWCNSFFRLHFSQEYSYNGIGFDSLT